MAIFSRQTLLKDILAIGCFSNRKCFQRLCVLVPIYTPFYAEIDGFNSIFCALLDHYFTLMNLPMCGLDSFFRTSKDLPQNSIRMPQEWT